jgi:HEAT repeat protein
MQPDKEIEDLINELQTKNAARRMRARDAIVKIGKPAVPYLINLLDNSKEHLRWEACKALGSIKDPKAAPYLVLALNDDNFAVQWLAAEALIALRNKAVIPLLEGLEANFKSLSMRQGAHHVLHALERKHLLTEETVSVVDTLRSLQPIIAVGVAAQKALISLGKTKQ